jgi:seryl-tRNA synthetase
MVINTQFWYYKINMLDIKFIRENKELITLGAQKKHMDFNVDALIEVDDKRRELLASIEKKKAEQNDVSRKIIGTPQEEKDKFVYAMQLVKNDLQKEEEKLKEIMMEWQKLMVQVPNIPDMTVPEGESDADNQEVRKWGDIPEFSFKPKSHIELSALHDMADFERGTKVSGFRGYFLKNDGARLSMALWQYGMDFFTSRGLDPMIVPSLVRRESLLGTGYLPQGEEDLYKTQDNDYLAGTAEVATMNYYSDEVIDIKDLPKKILSFSPCFRREAGSHGKDTKGLMRVHEFYKLEQVILCEASHEASVKFHEEINGNTEAFIESLGIPYHTVANCGGDLGLGQVKKYDINLWIPSENTYREISSASYFHDFQSRRLNIRYRDLDGKMRFVHSLNCTAIPTPRSLIAIMENFQQEDGSILIPEVLQKYMGKSLIEKPNAN